MNRGLDMNRKEGEEVSSMAISDFLENSLMNRIINH